MNIEKRQMTAADVDYFAALSRSSDPQRREGAKLVLSWIREAAEKQRGDPRAEAILNKLDEVKT